MDFAKVVAIIRPELLERVEETLKEHGVPGVSVSKVKGYGEYADFYSPDWMVQQIRVEVFIPMSQAEEIAEMIMEAAHTGVEGDGIVAIVPVQALYHIRTRRRCTDKAC